MRWWSLMRKWWPARDGQVVLRVCVGHWRELGWWPRPGSVFQWSGWLPDVWYLTKCAIWKRHDRLEIPTLPPTWNEWDNKLLHAAMAVFCDYMRVDSPSRWSLSDVDVALAKPDADTAWLLNYRPIAVEMEAIYRWWTIEREQERGEESQALMEWHRAFEAAGGMTSVPTDNSRLNRLVFADSDEENRLQAIYQAVEARNDAKEDEMLARLVAIRQHLWT